MLVKSFICISLSWKSSFEIPVLVQFRHDDDEISKSTNCLVQIDAPAPKFQGKIQHTRYGLIRAMPRFRHQSAYNAILFTFVSVASIFCL